MRVAIVDHVGNPGGGSRYLRLLVRAIKQLRPQIELVFFGNPAAIRREKVREEWEPLGIEVKALRSLWFLDRKIWGIRGTELLFQLMQKKFSHKLSFLPYVLSGAIHKELEVRLKGFDLAFFPWPYFLQCPQIDCPMVGVFHDFNYRYNFNGMGFAPLNLQALHRDMPIWLERAKGVVSTAFMRDEMRKFFPGRDAEVIPLAPMSAYSKMDLKEAQEVLAPLGLPKRYILYPTNISPHKNIGPLLSAVQVLYERGIEVPLVLVGYGTEALNGVACEIGIECRTEGKNVWGLGYVSNREIDALIQCAEVVVSTSLYEAGNGPGLDAWGKGVPVAMSKIPPYLEHLQYLGVKAKTFDPRNPFEIADRIAEILLHHVESKRDAEVSRAAISKRTWEDVARDYLRVFDEATTHSRL